MMLMDIIQIFNTAQFAIRDIDEILFIEKISQCLPVWNMGLVIRLVSIKQIEGQGNMTVSCDIQSENNLFAIRPEIFVVAMTNMSCIQF